MSLPASCKHDPAPLPTLEWVLEGSCETAAPHLRTIAPQLTWAREHFHVSAIEPADSDLPLLFRIELGERPVGAVNFLPLPRNRTLMRLYTCSDLGSACTIEDGDAIIAAFSSAVLSRLAQLGFLTTYTIEPSKRALGFRTAAPPLARHL